MSTHSDPQGSSCPAVFFDGKSAVRHDVTARLTEHCVQIAGDQIDLLDWSYDGLISHTPRKIPAGLTLSHTSMPDARLRTSEHALNAQLLRRAPHLTRHAARQRRLKNWAIAGAVLVTVSIGGYFFFPSATGALARAMPDAWRNKMGAFIEQRLLKGKETCESSEAVEILGKYLTAFSAKTGMDKAYSIKIWDTKLVNAFALPGGRIIVTTGLIEDVRHSNELAGVIAHEIGHVIERHPTQQMIRVFGLFPIASLLFGQTSGLAKTIGEIGALLLLLRYTRDNERQADIHAIRLLEGDNIDPRRLAGFFERRLKEARSGGNTAVFGILSTHPDLKDRIDRFKAAERPGGYRRLVNGWGWRALKRSCRAAE